MNAMGSKTTLAGLVLSLLLLPRAEALTLGGLGTLYAVELFRGTTPNSAITLPALRIASAHNIPAGSTLTLMLQFNGGRPVNQPAGSSAAVTAGGSISLSVGSTYSIASSAALGNGTPTATSNNADVLVYQIVTDTSIGIGSTLLTLTGLQLTAADLAELGAAVSVNAGLYVGLQTPEIGRSLSSSGLLEPLSSGGVAESAPGVLLSASSTGSSDQAIDVMAAVPGARFTSGGTPSKNDTGSTALIKLGTLGLINGNAKRADGSTPYDVAQAGAGGLLRVTVEAPAGYFAALGTTGRIYVTTGDALACAGTSTAAVSTAFNSPVEAASATKISLAAVALAATASGATPNPYHLCMSVDGRIPLLPATANISAQLGLTSSPQDGSTKTGPAPLLALANNGQLLDVISYFPMALSTYGYQSFVRVVNPGAVSVAMNIAFVDGPSGKASTSSSLGTIQAGSAVTFSAAQIEGLLGAQPIGARPRLRIAAPLGSRLQVQSFLQAPSGDISEVSGSN